MAVKKKSLWKKTLAALLNKYLVASVAIAVWVTFFDKDDLLSQRELTKKLNQLEDEKSYYCSEIEKCKKDISDLRSNSQHLEKFAREKYLMKKSNEEIFVIVYDSVSLKNHSVPSGL